MLHENISNLRKDYAQEHLDELDIEKNPISQFEKWINQAISSEVPEPTAMTLATANAENIVSARIVLLKDFSENGFSFFTNYNSHKSKDLSENKNASILFFWPLLERQIRIEGNVEKTSTEESNAYFKMRPDGSKIGAWASEQSAIIPNREYLDQRQKSLEEEFKNKEIHKPDHWGGFILKPSKIEFWQGRPNRLHDRIQYSLIENQWQINRLAP